MNIKQISVTPEQAQAWLANRDPNQRTVRKSQVAKYARDMLAGRWWLNPHPIIINKRGLVIDGQHRLLGVVQASVTVLMMVAFDVDGDYGSPIDQGRPRSAVDVIQNVNNAEIAAARALRSLHLANSHATFTTAEIRETIESHSSDLSACEVRNVTGIRWSGWLSGGLAYAYPLDPERISLLIDRVKTGELLKSGDPELALRNRLMQRHGFGSWELALLACQAAACVLDNRRTIRFERGGETGYRWLTTRRRVLRIANTPSRDQVDSIGAIKK